MRFIIVSREAPEVAGLYLKADGLASPVANDMEHLRVRVEAMVREQIHVVPPSGWELAGAVLKGVAPNILGAVVGGVLAGPMGAAWGASLGSESGSSARGDDTEASEVARVRPFAAATSSTTGAQIAAADPRTQFIAANPESIIRQDSQLLLAPHPSWAKLQLEHHCVTIACKVQPVGSARIDSAHPLLLGALDENQLRALESEDGGYSRIHVVNLRTARTVLRRLGGGVIEEGCYLLHPKREDVIVPLKTYHSDMLQEMTREAKGVLGRLGAKQLTIETTSGVSLGGEVVSNLPFRSGDLTVANASAQVARQISTWGSPTYDPTNALKDCVWIQDNAGLMTIIDQRLTSNLTTYEESTQVDTSFSVSLDMMKIFEAKFSWAEKSTYRYIVEFFDRPTAP